MDSAYLLIPILVPAILLYTISYIFYRMGILTKLAHHRIWNFILLLTFLVTALLGLLLVIQINYKLEWSAIKVILKWHVNFGIAMSFVAIIHLIWHFSYYLKIFQINRNSVQNDQTEELKPFQNVSNLWASVLLSGFISTTIQVLFLREVTTLFQGNELLLAWALGIWMILTGIGALFGRKSGLLQSANNPITRVLFILAIMPFICLIIMILIKGLLFPIGIIIHPAWFLIIVLLIFSPIGILSGWLFSAFVTISARANQEFINVYIFETIGSLIGGIFVAFVFISWLSTFQSILIISIIILVFLYFSTKKKGYLFSNLITVMLLMLLIFFPIENQLKSLVFNNQTIKKTIESRFGNITITENAGQYNIFENGVLSFTSENSLVSEEYVHYAMLQRPKIKRVLLVGGGLSGMLKEIGKYPEVEHIDYIEPNQQLVNLVSSYIQLHKDERIHLYNVDPRRFLNHTKYKYDAAILAIPDPSSLQINRFYTTGFIRTLKKNLTHTGIVLYGITPAGNYLSEEKTELEASVYNNLKTFFSFTEVIPGERDYFIASDSAVSINMNHLSQGWEEKNVYVNPYYMDEPSIRQRNEFILEAIKKVPTVNSDLRPRLVFSNTMYFMSMFKGTKQLLIILAVILLLIPLFYMPPAARGMFVTGVTASTVEITMIFIFQIVFGTLYAFIGFLIAVFMAGLATGALIYQKLRFIRQIQFISCIALAVTVALIPFCYQLSINAGTFISGLIIFSGTFIPSLIIGLLFCLFASDQKTSNKNTPGLIYAADLLGSAFGIILITIFLIPVIGIPYSCISIAAINVISGLFNFKKS